MKAHQITNEALPAFLMVLRHILTGMRTPSMFERGHVLIHRYWRQIWGKTPVKLSPEKLKKLDKLQKRAKENQEYIESKDFIGRLQAKPDKMLTQGELRNLGKVIRDQEKTVGQIKDIIKNAEPYARPTASQTLKGPQ